MNFFKYFVSSLFLSLVLFNYSPNLSFASQTVNTTQLASLTMQVQSIQLIIKQLEDSFYKFFNLKNTSQLALMAPVKGGKTIALIKSSCSGYTEGVDCFTSLFDWEAAYGGIDFKNAGCSVGDLVCANTTAVAKIDGDWLSPDTKTIKIDGWVTDATHYIKIYTTKNARHNGKWNNTKYRLVSSKAGSLISLPGNGTMFIKIDGLQLWNNYSGDSSISDISLQSTDNTEIDISNNILRGPDTSSNSAELSGISSVAGIERTIKVWNNISYNWVGDNKGICFSIYNTNIDFFNNTAYNCRKGVRTLGGDNFHAYNNIFYKVAIPFSSSNPLRKSSYNLTDKSFMYSYWGSEHPGNSNDILSTNSFFVSTNKGSEDLHLSSLDVSSKGTGINLSNNVDLSFLTDIDGDLRGSSWDRGADEYSASADSTDTTPADTTPPTTPTNLVAAPISSSQINLTWTASTDATGVSGYNIYRCAGSSCTPSTLVATSTASSYSDTKLQTNTNYTYAVSAYDSVGNTSSHSSEATVVTKSLIKPAGVFFSDGFESGELNTKGVDNAGWNGINHSSKDAVLVSTDRAYRGTHSLKFHYHGDSNLSSDAWSEIRYKTGKKQTDWYLRYYIYFPTNFEIRDANGADNNKFATVWGDSYLNSQVAFNMEMEKDESVGFKLKRNAWPYDKLDCSGKLAAGPNQPRFTFTNYKGKWTEIQLHYKIDDGSGDGQTQLWVNGKLVISVNNQSYQGAPCSPGYMLNGYLMGWSNSGFDKDTDVYIDDVAFSNKYIGPVSTDTTPPTTPTNLVATPISSSQINLVWTASAGAIGYNIYRCTGSSCTPSTLVATSTASSYSDTTLQTNTNYTYAVSAYDSVGNTSSHSSEATVVTKNSSNKIDLNYYKVVSATPKIISTPLTKAYPSVQYDIRLGVVGGLYPYTFSLLDSPSGMVIDKKKGEIRWTPDSSLNGKSFNVKVKVEDLLGQAVYQQYTLNVGRSGFYFVSPLGSDVNGDGSVSNPWATISYAINQRGSSDYLYVRGGNYIGPIEFLKNHLKTIIAYPGETPIIDYELSTSDPLESNTYIDGLKIHNIQRWAFSIGRPLVGFTLRRSELYDLYDNSVGGNPAFLFTWDAGKHTDMYKNIIIQDDVFHDLYDRNSGINGDTSANYHGGSVVWFDVGWSLYEGNTVYNIDGDCIKDKDDGHYNTFRSNYAYSCHSHSLGLKNQYTQYGIEVDHNIFERGIKIGSQPVPQYLENISIHDNTILGHIDVAVSLRKNLYFYNNIVYNPGVYAYTFGSKWCSGGSQNYSLLHFDDNLIFSDKKTFLSLIGCPRPNWRIDKTAEQAQVLGIDPHSYFTDPLFRNIANKDFTPQSLKACGTGLFGGDIGAVSCSASSSVLFSINSPVVSVVSQGHSGSNAVITWKTNKESTSQVNYGFDTLYKHQTVEDKTLTKLHVVKLEGLSSNASIYHYQVKSIDKDGNEVTSIDKTFITLGTKEGDSKKPSTIKNLKVSDITKNSALLTWSAPSNDFDNLIPSSATKQYDIRYSIHKITQSNFENAVQITGEPTPSTYGKTDTMQVVGLTPNMTYYIAIRSTDSSGNVSLISNVMKFTTSSNLITKISPAKVVSNGGGGGGYYYVEKTPLYKINNFIITPADKQITLTWSNSKNKNFVRVVIFRSTNKIKNGVLVKDLMKDKNIKKIYEGVGTKYVDINLNNFVTYYYAISAYDKNYNYSNPLIKEGKPESGKKFIQSFSAPLNQRKFNSVVSKQTYTIKQIVNTNLRPGLQNKEVLKLQKILSQDRDIYPEGIITGYYGNLTRKAVRRFQCKYKVVCSGSPLSTGYGLVGPKTRAKLNQIYTGVSNSSTLFSTSTKTTVTQNNNFSLNSKKTSNSTFVKYKSFSQREVIRSIQNQIATLLNIVSTLTKELNKMMGI